jgi:hypothetical protein
VNLKLLLCIVMGVFVAHLGVLALINQLRPKPRLVPPPKPNFSAKATVVVDEKSGEKTTYREITVSTKFAATPPPATPAPSETKSDDTPASQE